MRPREGWGCSRESWGWENGGATCFFELGPLCLKGCLFGLRGLSSGGPGPETQNGLGGLDPSRCAVQSGVGGHVPFRAEVQSDAFCTSIKL